MPLPLAAVGAATPALPTLPTLPTAATAGITGTDAAGRTFGQVLAGATDGVQAAQDRADGLAVQAATGDLTDVHDYMIAATEAAIATELTVAVRNKAVEAFQQIMSMPV